MRIVSTIRSSKRAPLLQVLKTSAAAIIAWLLCTIFLGQPLPIFAAIAALLVVQPSVNQSLAKGIERSVGVVAGVAVAYVIGHFFGNSSLIVLSAIVLSLLLAWAFRLSPGSTNQIPISAMLVLAIGSHTPDYAFERIFETIIGAVVGLVINTLIVPPVHLRPAHLAVSRLLRDTAASMESLATALREPRSTAELAELLSSARKLRGLQASASDALEAAAESLTLNPRKGRFRDTMHRDADLLKRLDVLVTRVIGMTRALHDHYDPTLHDEPMVAGIATELERAAHDLRLLGKNTHSEELEPITLELPALTAPLTIARPSQDHWVLIGSLMEDLRRVREAIISAEDA